MSNLIRINEFSRKFGEPKWSEKLKRYVSSSFNKDIGFCTVEVPPEIEQAILQDQLRINDNYPFALGEKALIAREMGQYSILAVAINGSDDGNRPLIAYRYFWLENIDTSEFDGVGTLLKWWEEKGQPFCDIKPHTDYEKELREHGEDYYQATPIYQKYSEQFQQQTKAYKNQTKKDLDPNQIGEKPYIFPIHKKGDIVLPNYWGIHALALQLNNKYRNAPIAWSWNTSVMNKPIHFSLICCADENNYKLQVKWDKSSERLIINSIPRIPKPQFLRKTQKSDTVNLILKRCLLNLSKDSLKRSELDYLIDIIENTDSLYFTREQLIDQTFYKYNLETEVTESGIKYSALLVLVLSLETAKINEWLSLLSQQSQESQRKAIELQIQLLDYAEQNQKEKAYQKLCDRIQIIIIECLFNLAQSEQKDISAKFARWLLVDSSQTLHQTLVKRSYPEKFKTYATLLLKQLEENYKLPQLLRQNNMINSLNSINLDKFCESIIKDLYYYSDNQNPQLFSQYRRIAKIFDQARCYSLAAFFSQISLGYVPQEIYNQCSDLYQIIPLKRNYKTAKSPSNNNARNLVTKLLRNSYTEITNTITEFTNIMLLVLLTLGAFGAGAFLIDRFFLSSNPMPPEPSETFQPFETGNLVAYSYVESLTPEIEQTLSQETLTKMKVDNVLAKNTQGDETSNKVSALMQPILKSLGFYKVDLTNTWDQPTSAAIKSFQVHYKLPVTGNLDQATWDILYMMIKDKQVKETAIVLQSILTSSQNSAALEQKMTELEQCKNEPVTYFNCINQLKPQSDQ